MNPIVYSTQHQPEGRSRLTVFFRLLLAIPWGIVATVWGIAVFFSVVFAWFALLFTGRYPGGLYNFNADYLRFIGRVHGWMWLMTDEWPSFSGKDDPDFPVRTVIGPPKGEYSRVKTFFRLIYGIPVYILTYIMQIITQLVGFVTWVWMVISGKHPEGLYKPARSALAYQIKAFGFWMLLIEDYPSFWMDQADEEAELASFGAADAAGEGTPAPPPPPAPAAG